MRVHVVADPAGRFAQAVRREAAPYAKLTITIAKEADSADVISDDVSVLVTGRPTEALLDGSPSLAWVVVPFAGIPRATAEVLAARPDIALTNLHHNSSPTAEHALALLLAAARQIVPADRQLRVSDWSIRYDDNESVIIAGKRALILGVGAVGGRIARVLEALDVSVRGVVRKVEGHPKAASVSLLPLEALDDALPEADLLICTLPETRATRGLIDARRLARLPAGAILVNVGRGAVIEEKALYEALRDGPLAAAGIDVWYQYPEEKSERTATEPGSFPFASLDNLVLSPHRAGHGVGIEILRAQHLVAALLEIEEETRGKIDLARGY